MAYRVATDSKGAMSKNWMEAAGQSGIPSAFIVNGDGKIAWIGHPMQMDKPLDQVLEGKWDLEAAAKKFKEDRDKQKKLQELSQKLNKAAKSGDVKEMLTVLDKAIEDDPKLEKISMVARFKLQLLAGQTDSGDKIEAYGKHLVDSVFAEDAESLNEIAWGIVGQPRKPDAKMAKVALKAAMRADELAKHKDASIADTLARACFVSGDIAKAVENQERAVKLAEGTPQASDGNLKKHLEEYRKAAEKKNEEK
jgi:hypothetical protein